MPDDDILTVAQVAAEFNVTAQTIRAWIRDGKLRASRVGKSHNILRGDVYAMLASATVAQRPQRAPDMWDQPASELPASRSPAMRNRRRCGPSSARATEAVLVARQPG